MQVLEPSLGAPVKPALRLVGGQYRQRRGGLGRGLARLTRGALLRLLDQALRDEGGAVLRGGELGDVGGRGGGIAAPDAWAQQRSLSRRGWAKY